MEFVRNLGRYKALKKTVVLLIVILILAYFCTQHFNNWSSDNIELLGLSLSALALLIAFLAFCSQSISLDVQISDSKHSIASIIEQQEETTKLLKKIDRKNELQQIIFRYEVLRSSVESLVVVADKEYRGKEVFEQLFLNVPYKYGFRTFKGIYDFLKGPGDGCYSKSESIPALSSYFNRLYDYLSCVDSCEFLSEEEKKSYMDILIDSMSMYEMLFMYYHGLTDRISPLRSLIEKYHLLESIDFEYVIADNNCAHYEESAFGRNGHIYTEKREREIAQWPCNQH